MQIVAVQLDMAWQDKITNHNKVRELLSQETIEPNSLIILPEMFDTGFSMDLHETAQTDDLESEAILKELAAKYESAVIGGVVGPVDGDRGSNEAVAFAPDGSELVRYQKMQPFTPAGEDVKYGAGEQHAIFEWEGAAVAPYICYDLRFPEVFRPAAYEGAELFVVMACWPATRSEHWVRLLQARAIENQACVVGVNRCGSDPKLEYDGRTVVFDQQGIALFEADANEQVVKVEIDLEAVRDWRESFPALADMR